MERETVRWLIGDELLYLITWDNIKSICTASYLAVKLRNLATLAASMPDDSQEGETKVWYDFE